MQTRTKVITGIVSGVLILGLVAVGVLVGVSYYVLKRIDNPELVKKLEAAKSDGTEFGKTTDQNGCMDKGLTLPSPSDSFDIRDHYFVKACLRSSRPTADFCDGVPFLLDRDWFDKKCSAFGNNAACIEAFTAKRDFCHRVGDKG